MNRVRTGIVVAVGVALVAIGVVMGTGGGPTESDSLTMGTVLLALLALAVAVWKIRGSLDTATDTPVPWAEADQFATPAPERTDREPRLSAETFGRVIDRAGTAARAGQTVDDGIAVVRPVLREALGEALVAGGHSKSTAKAAIDDGSWTDDRVAASVLSSDVEPPLQPFRDRFWAWLTPERVVRRRAVRAMAAVADAADEALPTVPGQTAPRNVPVLQPRLEELTRGADGRLQRAVDPTAIARGPQPPAPRSGTARTAVADTDSSESETGADGTTEPEPTGTPDPDREPDETADDVLNRTAEEGTNG